ncbi:MAG: efflux RND transporter periplasmic adaptor subunit [Phycisphaerales bacterium]|nr:efflux RND transporter periplasmic adaptor subunit [Phycisphaerales bacterium]
MMMNRFAPPVWVGVLLLSMGLAPAQPGRSPADVGRRQIDPAVVREFAGTKAVTRPCRDAIMKFPQATQIKEVLASGGRAVKAGEVMVRGDDTEDQALLLLQKMRAESDLPVQRAQKAMELAQAEHENLKKVRGGGGSSEFEFERARLQAETARIDWETAKINQEQERLQVDRLKARVDRLRLIAPFDGVIDVVAVDVGHSVSESETVLRIVDVDPLYIDVPAPMEDASTLQLRERDKAWVLVDVAGNPRLLEGKVIEVAPTSDAASRTRRVRVELANPEGAARLVAGEPAWVRFAQPPEDLARRLGPTIASDRP